MSAQVWTPTGAPLAGWISVASSADGTKLIASGDDTYISTNSGSTWSLKLPGVGGYPYVASSTNGAKLLVVSGNGVFASANSGASWATNTSLNGMSWQGVAASADGTKFVAVANADPDGNPGLIYVSSDSGNTWNPTSAPSNFWSSVASSADGTRLVAVAISDSSGNNGGPIYVSSDSGNTWNLATAPNYSWNSVASSADGTRLVAAPMNDGHGLAVPIYTSTDSGTTWNANTTTTNPAYSNESMAANYWSHVASSADGTKLTAFGQLEDEWNIHAGLIAISTNAGTNWTITTSLEMTWASAASSADGSKVVVAVNGDGIYTDAATTSWALAGAPATNFWQSIVASEDGTRQVAAAGYNYFTGANGPVYRSTNSGATWVPIPALNTNGTLAVASSPDGTKLIAAGEFVETSTNSGATWQLTSVTASNWVSAAVSSNGSTLAVVCGGALESGPIYVSTNSGITWAPGGNAPTAGGWSSVACSWDGTKMVAAQNFSSFGYYGAVPGYIYISTNSGSTWSPASVPSGGWVSVASSADGTHLVAASQPNVEYYTPGLIYFSTNSGLTWSSNSAVNATWSSVASSADGTKFVAVDNAGLVLVSTNSGTTWATNLAPIVAWQPVAMSGDGSKIIAGAAYGSIYISQSVQSAGPPRLSISLSGNQAFLTWPTNAAGFNLQQNTNLLTTNWVTVTNIPVVTNILYQVTVPTTHSQNFYRLATP
jgi:hypothetical protein